MLIIISDYKYVIMLIINYINLHETIEYPPASKTLGFLFEKKIKF